MIEMDGMKYKLSKHFIDPNPSHFFQATCTKNILIVDL
jgi:hypothetical protein